VSAVPLPLTTDRLVLRLLTADDTDAMHSYRGLAEVNRYLYRLPDSRQRCAELIASAAGGTTWQADGDALVLAVCRRGAPGLIGEVVLRLRDAAARQAEIGWTFDPAHHGRGYATEAARALLALAFGTLGVHRVYARVDVDNAASVRVAGKLGMRREAHLVENDVDPVRGWGSEFIYAILDREFRP
jgi:RimJ/RimL family protein N-acetyltransferase